MLISLGAVVDNIWLAENGQIIRERIGWDENLDAKKYFHVIQKDLLKDIKDIIIDHNQRLTPAQYETKQALEKAIDGMD